MPSPAQTAVWQSLKEERLAWNDLHVRDLFAQDEKRFERFSLQLDDLLLDYSKNLIRPQTLELLLKLAADTGVEALRDALFAGEKINLTEGRAVLHTALRNRSERPVVVDGQLVRYAAIGTTRDQADAELLKQVVQTGLAACVQDAVRMQDSPEVAHRAKWLVAIPLFGTRAGGFDAVRGEALKAVLAAAKWAADQCIDVAIVCCDHRSRSAARAGR